MKNIKSLQIINNATSKLHAESIADPLRWWNPTPVQERVLSDSSKMVLLRGGNQIGKTACGAFETICRLMGKHPYKTVSPGPIEAWIIVHSWEQSKTIQAKFWEMMPKNFLHSSVEYNPSRGFRGTGAPVIRCNNGSIARFKTTNQGTLGLSAGTVDFIWCDEPPPAHVIGELKSRITRKRGSMLMTLTPIGAPLEYLKKMVEDGLVSEHVGVMNVENCTPRNCRPLMTADEIEKLRMSFLPLDRDARMSGAWIGGIPEGRIFDHFSDDHISDLVPDPNKEYIWSIGIDHGHEIGSQVAILVAVDITNRAKPIIYVVDEYIAGQASAESHARSIIAMIRRNNLSIPDILRWTGDRAHGGSRNGGRMSNNMLMSAFSKVLRYDKGVLPFRIRTAYKPRFSVYYGCQVLHESMCDSRFQIFPKCKNTIQSLKFWALKKSGGMDTMSEWKHCVDALRYATIQIVDTQYRAPKQSKLRI